MTDGSSATQRRRSRWTGIAGRAATAGLAAALFALRHDGGAAAGVLAAAFVLTLVSVAWPAAADRIDRGFAAVGRAIGGAIALGATGIIELVVGLPGRAKALISRRSPLTGLGPGAASSWRVSSAGASVDVDRAFGGDIPRRRGSGDGARTVSLRFLGVLVVLLFLDSAVGVGAQVVAPAPTGSVFAVHLRLEHVGELAPVGGQPSLIPPVSPSASDAFAGEPWHATLRSQERSTSYHWQPYVTFEAVDTAGSLVHIRNGVRRSWEPPGPAGTRPIVWFFGGSTMQGIGQRDDHTIPSEVSRLAARAGHPITVVNFGVVGATNYTEALQLEQQLAVRRRPDLVVFYDGATDTGVQAFYPSLQPTQPPVTLRYRTTSPSLFDRWRSVSVTYRLLSNIGRRLFPPAGATPSDTMPREAAAAAVAHDTVSLYRRGVSLALGFVPAGVTPFFFWQPTQWGPASAVMTAVRAALPSSTIDLSNALRDVSRPVYLDPIHTNELGARIVAEHIWSSIEGDVR